MGTELNKLKVDFSDQYLNLLFLGNYVYKMQQENVLCKEYDPVIDYVCIHNFKLNFPCK